MKTLILILAAGLGKRMHSARAKVRQPLAGRPMISHLLATLRDVEATTQAIIYGHDGEELQAELRPEYPHLQWILQAVPRGTGDAVRVANREIAAHEVVLIVTGDTPLVAGDDLQRLLARAGETGFALLTANVPNPTGYGRIVRGEDGEIVAIVEEKDASPAQRAIAEVNTGIIAVRSEILLTYLPQLRAENQQGEFYLTDVVALARADGRAVVGVPVDDYLTTLGINDRVQLAAAEGVLRARAAQQLLQAGATLLDPARIDVHGEVRVGRDVVIEPNVFFKGRVVLGDNVYIENGCTLIDCTIGDNVRICGQSRLEQCTVGAGAQVGPFARLRPQTVLAEGARVGNFVEIKAATIGAGSKVNHLSYIGDARLGAEVNIGAGTITCNYDGANKFVTTLGDRVFIGSNSALVAPVTIGDGATIGAGSVISKNVAAQQLALTRAPQKTVAGWQRPTKKK